MLVNREQEFYMDELFYNTEAIGDILEDMLSNELNDGIGNIDNQFCCELLKYLLIEEQNILNEYVFTRDFMQELKMNLEKGLSSCDGDKKNISKRIIRLLQQKLSKTDNYLFSNEIYLVAFNLIDDFINNTKNQDLKNELSKLKYDIALLKPEFTYECLERNFSFIDNIYVCPDSYHFIYDVNVFDDEYYKTIIKFYTFDLLKIKNEEYGDVEKQAKAHFYYSMIKSCTIFLKEALSWEFFEKIIGEEFKETYGSELLKSVLTSKEDVLKRIKFMTINR